MSKYKPIRQIKHRFMREDASDYAKGALMGTLDGDYDSSGATNKSDYAAGAMAGTGEIDYDSSTAATSKPDASSTPSSTTPSSDTSNTNESVMSKQMFNEWLSRIRTLSGMKD